MIHFYRHHREGVYCTAFAGDILSADLFNLKHNQCCAGVFASGSKDGTIAIWDLFADKMKSRQNT